jgi:hypothetical protein
MWKTLRHLRGNLAASPNRIAFAWALRSTIATSPPLVARPALGLGHVRFQADHQERVALGQDALGGRALDRRGFRHFAEIKAQVASLLGEAE